MSMAGGPHAKPNNIHEVGEPPTLGLGACFPNDQNIISHPCLISPSHFYFCHGSSERTETHLTNAHSLFNLK